jgi:hypothetical protein
MRKEGFICAVVWCLVLIWIQACHRVDGDHAPASVSDEKEVRSNSSVDPSKGNVFEEGMHTPEPADEMEQGIDILWTLFPGEPQRSFQRGRQDYLAKKYRTASQSIQKSTLYVKLQSLRAFGPTKNALLDAESALSTLAKDAAKGKNHALARLDTTFAATQRAIARLHHEKATAAYARGQPRSAGVELQAAKESLGKAAVWTGDHVYPPLMDCLDKVESNAQRLMAGLDSSSVATRRTLSELGAQIDRLDRKAELEDTRGVFSGETNFYLKEAQGRVEKSDRQGGAGSIRRASACMAVEAFGSFGEAQGLLEEEIDALRKTADKLEKGSLTSLGKLEQRFASAQYALARAHHIRASRYDSQHYYKRAVAALGAAVTDLERAASWAGKGIKNSSARVMRDVKDMSTRMREGLSVKPEEISAAVSGLQKAIERLDDLSVSP